MNNRIYNSLNRWAGLVLVIFVAVLLFALTPQALAQQKGEAQGIVDKALITFKGFMNDKNYTWIQNNLNRAEGILIFPQVLKAGFILGGSGGTGVLLAKDKKGTWSQPAFYTMGTVNFGLLAGAQAAEVVIMIMKRSTLDSLYTTSVKLGSGAGSIAVGPHGAEATGNLTASMISFAKSKGLYAGLNLEGSVVGVRGKVNKAYYGKEVSPIQIIVENKVQDEGTTNLRSGLKKAAK
jgi:lipid-binding SYLF domain-containing protein